MFINSKKTKDSIKRGREIEKQKLSVMADVQNKQNA